MIGAEPPQLQHHQAKLGATVLEVRGWNLEKEDQFGMTLKASASRSGRRDRQHRRRLGQRPAGLMAALSGEDERAAPDSIRLFGKPIGNHSPRRRRKEGLHFVPEAPRPRRGADAVAGAEHAAHAHRDGVGRGLDQRQRGEPAGRQPDQPLQRARRRQPARRRRCRAATCRSSSSGADRCQSPNCSSSRSRPGASTSAPRRRSAASCSRCATRAARCSSSAGARRAVRDLRPARRHRAGPGLAVGADGAGDDRDDRRRMSNLWAKGGAGPCPRGRRCPCLKFESRPSRRA